MRWCGVFVWFVFSAPMVRSLLNATSNSDISSSERMLTNLEKSPENDCGSAKVQKRKKNCIGEYVLSLHWATFAEVAQMKPKVCFACLYKKKSSLLRISHTKRKFSIFQYLIYLTWKLWVCEEITGLRPRGSKARAALQRELVARGRSRRSCSGYSRTLRACLFAAAVLKAEMFLTHGVRAVPGHECNGWP